MVYFLLKFDHYQHIVLRLNKTTMKGKSLFFCFQILSNFTDNLKYSKLHGDDVTCAAHEEATTDSDLLSHKTTFLVSILNTISFLTMKETAQKYLYLRTKNVSTEKVAFPIA